MKKIVLFVVFLQYNFYFAQGEISGRNAPYRATSTKLTELKHTKLKVSFDFKKEQMRGEAWITASPFFYPTKELILDAKAMLIHEVSLKNNEKNISLKYEYKDDKITVFLDKEYSRNQNYTVYIRYTARPNEVKQKGSVSIKEAKGLYFINPRGAEPNKPTQIWTQGETESSSCWFPTIDKPNQKTTQEIYITVPEKYITLSNGILQSSVKESFGMRTDHWVMDKKHAPYLFFMGVGEYAVVKDQWKNIEVNYYVEKEYEPYAKQIFGMTPEMLDFFSKKLHYEYPWQKYAQIVGRDYVSGAMENTTAVIFQEGIQQKEGDLIDENTWEDTIAHELFHHWFGDLVTTESWSNLTVNESFATYSSYLWYEYKYGKDFADFWLWESLRGYFEDSENISKDLVRFNYHDKEDMFDSVSYNKGSGILHMLRNYLGDDAFFQGLYEYLKTNEYGTGEAHQIRLALEKVSGKDLNWFFNQWFFDSGHPNLEVKYSLEPIKKEIIINITQNGKLFEFPLAIDVFEGKKVKRHQVWVNAQNTNIFVFKYDQTPNTINVDADGVLLAEIKDNKSTEEYLHQYLYSKDLKSRLLAIHHAKENLDKNPAAIQIIRAALKDPFHKIRIEAMNAIDIKKPLIVKQLIPDVERIANNDPKTLAQSKAIFLLAETGNKKYLPVFEKGVLALSNSVKANSVYGISKVAPEKLGNLLYNINLDFAKEDILTALLPHILENKIEKHRVSIASLVAFYPFISFQNPDAGEHAKRGFDWIMDSDDLKAVMRLTNILRQARSKINNNSQAKMIIVKILTSGLERKMILFRQNIDNESLNEQIKLINKTIQIYQ